MTRIGFVSLDTLANNLLVICLLFLERRVTRDVPFALEKLVMVELSDLVNLK